MCVVVCMVSGCGLCVEAFSAFVIFVFSCSFHFTIFLFVSRVVFGTDFFFHHLFFVIFIFRHLFRVIFCCCERLRSKEGPKHLNM